MVSLPLLISADRNIDSDGLRPLESFTPLSERATTAARFAAQEFDLDGIAEQESITLTRCLNFDLAELRLGLDLDNNEIIGAPDAQSNSLIATATAITMAKPVAI